MIDLDALVFTAGFSPSWVILHAETLVLISVEVKLTNSQKLQYEIVLYGKKTPYGIEILNGSLDNLTHGEEQRTQGHQSEERRNMKRKKIKKLETAGMAGRDDRRLLLARLAGSSRS